MVPRCQKCNADRRKVIIVRNVVGHVTDLELHVSGALSQCPSGDPAQQVQSSMKIVSQNWARVEKTNVLSGERKGNEFRCVANAKIFA